MLTDGLICVPVCASTSGEMLERVTQAEPLADLIELRFDCLEPAEIQDLLATLTRTPVGKPLLATFRSREQGGHGQASYEERLAFWRALDLHSFAAADVEEDIIVAAPPVEVLIASHHDFESIPADLDDIFARLTSSPASVIKIAATAHDIADAIAVWKLLERGEEAGKQVIPVAMGEAGKWTRILGLAHGAFLTYASLGERKGTADGQITAADMRDLYRVKELTKETRVFGVIGDPVSSSMSPYMHNAAFNTAAIDAVFMHLQVKDLDAFMRRMVLAASREVELNFGGFSVTMPHKQAVMQYLDDIDGTAKQIGAVNTVKIEGERLIGYNTDAHGFITPLKERYGELGGCRAAVVGAGGAARACLHALRAERANVTVFVRQSEKAADFMDSFGVDVVDISNLRSEIGNFDLVVNATPIGMKGQYADKTLLTADDLNGVKFVYDLVTRADDTPLVREAHLAGVSAIGGIEMLIAQGARQFEIWTRQTAPVDVMRSAIDKRMRG